MEEEKRCVIGMDCGTTNIKAVAVCADGSIIAKASKESRMSSQNGVYREQEADCWWEDAAEVLRKIAEAVREKGGRTEAVAVSSHTVSLLALDGKGEPVRTAILYQDSRSVKEVKYITDRIGYERFVQIVGGQPAPAFLPGKLLWFKENEPELFKKTRWIVQVLGVDLEKILPAISPVDHIVGAEKQSSPTVPVVTRPCAIREMPWIFDVPVTTTGAVLKWFIDTFGDREKKRCLQQKKSGADVKFINTASMNIVQE